MKFIEEAEAQVRLGEILDEAQRRPIVIRRKGRISRPSCGSVAGLGMSGNCHIQGDSGRATRDSAPASACIRATIASNTRATGDCRAVKTSDRDW